MVIYKEHKADKVRLPTSIGLYFIRTDGCWFAEIVPVRRRCQLRAADGLHARREGQARGLTQKRAGTDSVIMGLE